MSCISRVRLCSFFGYWTQFQPDVRKKYIFFLCLLYVLAKKLFFYTDVYCTIHHSPLYCSHLCVFISCNTLYPFPGGQDNILHIILSVLLSRVVLGIQMGQNKIYSKLRCMIWIFHLNYKYIKGWKCWYYFI